MELSKNELSAISILCITAIEVVALVAGIDGALFGIVIAAIAGLGGFTVGSYAKPAPE